MNPETPSEDPVNGYVEQVRKQMETLDSAGLDWSATPAFLQTLEEHNPRQTQVMGEEDLAEDEEVEMN